MSKFFRYLALGYLALLFNGELYAHSLGALFMPTLVLMYIVLLLILDLLIKKYNLSSPKLFLIGSLVGLSLETFYSKSIFVNPLFWGVNWLSVLIQFLYWGMAVTLPFYVIQRIKDRKIFKQHKSLDVYIVLYLILELVLGTILKYPVTIWIWIATGIPLGIAVLYKTIKDKDFIQS